MPWTPDPVLARACGAAVSLVLLLAAWHKWRDLDVFEAALARYGLLAEAMVRPVSRLLPAAEAIAGAALLFEATRVAGAVLAAALLFAVTAAVAINLLRGVTGIDCGCGGPESRQPLGWGLVLRNGFLLLATLAGAQEGTARELVWLDYLTVAGATLALLGLYAGANQLMSNQPRMAALRS